jgi:hypothetical protein
MAVGQSPVAVNKGKAVNSLAVFSQQAVLLQLSESGPQLLPQSFGGIIFMVKMDLCFAPGPPAEGRKEVEHVRIILLDWMKKSMAREPSRGIWKARCALFVLVVPALNPLKGFLAGSVMERFKVIADG